MKMYDLSCLLLLLFCTIWGAVDCLCSLDKYTAALCHDLEDARYINTYHLYTLRAPSSSKILSPGNFQNLTSLRHLDLSSGNIEIIKSGSFAKLESLQTLNLADNHISHLEAGAFDGLTHIRSLKLEGNAIGQLPSALMSLKGLKLLDISNNPLSCNCASMKLRDALSARGIKIVKRTYCSEPISVKHASIWKPDTKTTCIFEKQDSEMQRDQPLEGNVDGSGEMEEDDILPEIEKDLAYDDKEDDQSSTNANEEETTASPTTPEVNLSSSTTLTMSSESVSPGTVSSSTSVTKDDITFEDTEDSTRKETTTSISIVAVVKPEELEESDKTDDLIISSNVPKTSYTSDEPVSSSDASTSGNMDDIVVPYEGSGENDDDGSGSEGSGIIARMPGIDFNETSGGFEDEEVQASSSSTTTTTESSSWWGLGNIISHLNPWGTSDTTEAPKTTEKSPEDDLKEEQFIQVTHESSTKKIIDKVDSVIIPNTIPTDERASKQTPKAHDLPNRDFEDNSVDSAPSQETKKGIGSYVVLITLLVILVILLSFAAYKGDFCRKKRKRRDVERGTEMKDMQRTLLDQNATQPKVQTLNGSTMENVPLMNSATLPEEPKNNQKSYDISPTVITNGLSRTNGIAIEVNDPVKPSRKSLKQEIEAPLNGLNPPMEAIDAPIGNSIHGDSNEIINTLDYCERPPLTPGAHKVKITLQENPDSVPKTPILITRVKDGENLVKAP